MVNLKEWSFQYFKFRAKFEKFEVVEKKDCLEIKTKVLKDIVTWHEDLSKVKESNYMVTYNTKNNVDYLADSWAKFLKPNIKIIFINPDSSKWIIIPYIHDKVCDQKDIKRSLLSLSGVEG